MKIEITYQFTYLDENGRKPDTDIVIVKSWNSSDMPDFDFMKGYIKNCVSPFRKLEKIVSAKIIEQK